LTDDPFGKQCIQKAVDGRFIEATMLFSQCSEKICCTIYVTFREEGQKRDADFRLPVPFRF